MVGQTEGHEQTHQGLNLDSLNRRILGNVTHIVEFYASCGFVSVDAVRGRARRGEAGRRRYGDRCRDAFLQMMVCHLWALGFLIGQAVNRSATLNVPPCLDDLAGTLQDSIEL